MKRGANLQHIARMKRFLSLFEELDCSEEEVVSMLVDALEREKAFEDMKQTNETLLRQSKKYYAIARKLKAENTKLQNQFDATRKENNLYKEQIDAITKPVYTVDRNGQISRKKPNEWSV